MNKAPLLVFLIALPFISLAQSKSFDASKVGFVIHAFEQKLGASCSFNSSNQTPGPYVFYCANDINQGVFEFEILNDTEFSGVGESDFLLNDRYSYDYGHCKFSGKFESNTVVDFQITCARPSI